jgi:hypothetical protein
MRADAIPEHLITHRKNLPALMTEESRRWCCDKQLPLFYQTDKWVCCLICKKGKTLHSIGETIREFTTNHETSGCRKQFASVADIYAIDAPADAPVAEMPLSVQFATTPTLSTMATCHKTFGFENFEKLMPINEQLALMCRKYEAEVLKVRAAAAAPLPTRNFVETESLMEESERQRLAILAAREAEREYLSRPREPPRLVVKEEPKAIEKPAEVPVALTPPLPSPVPTVKDEEPVPAPIAKPIRKLTVVKTVPAPVEVAKLPPSPPSETEQPVTPPKKKNRHTQQMIECLEYFVDLDDVAILADHTFKDTYENAKREMSEAKHPDGMVRELLDIFTSFINRRCTIKQAYAQAIALA